MILENTKSEYLRDLEIYFEESVVRAKQLERKKKLMSVAKTMLSSAAVIDEETTLGEIYAEADGLIKDIVESARSNYQVIAAETSGDIADAQATIYKTGEAYYKIKKSVQKKTGEWFGESSSLSESISQTQARIEHLNFKRHQQKEMLAAANGKAKTAREKGFFAIVFEALGGIFA